MKISNQKLGDVYVIRDVPKNNPCADCNNCIRLRMMEMGLMPGTKISLLKHDLGLWVLSILNDSNTVESTIALRDDEAERIILEDECLISFEKN